MNDLIHFLLPYQLPYEDTTPAGVEQDEQEELK